MIDIGILEVVIVVVVVVVVAQVLVVVVVVAAVVVVVGSLSPVVSRGIPLPPVVPRGLLFRFFMFWLLIWWRLPWSLVVSRCIPLPPVVSRIVSSGSGCVFGVGSLPPVVSSCVALVVSLCLP